MCLRMKITLLILLWGTIGYSALRIAHVMPGLFCLFTVALLVSVHIVALKTIR